MKVKVITDGTPEGTRIINVYSGKYLENLEVVEFERDVNPLDYSNVMHSIINNEDDNKKT